MTTAHRPTWHTARGGTEQGGNVLVNPSRAYSSKDMPAHTHMKHRAPGQGNQHEQGQIDFRLELLEREAQLKLDGSDGGTLAGTKRLRDEVKAVADLQQQSLQLKDHDEEEQVYEEDDDEGSNGASGHIAAKRFKQGDGEHLEAAEPRQAKKELTFPHIENPFAQDADFEDFDLAAEFWTKPKKQNVASLAAASKT